MRLSRRLTMLPQLGDAIELFAGVGRILMEIDGQIDRFVELLEEER